MRQLGPKIKTELKQIGYYDLFYLDTSFTSVLEGKLSKNWRGTILDFLETPVLPEGKVYLSLMSRKVQTEVVWELILWGIKKYEAKMNIKSLALMQIKKEARKVIDSGVAFYTEWNNIKRSVDYKTSAMLKTDIDKIFIEQCCIFDGYIGASNVIRFLIKNNFVSYIEVVNKLKELVKYYSL